MQGHQNIIKSMTHLWAHMQHCGVQAVVIQGEVFRFFIVALLVIFIVLESVHIFPRQHRQPVLVLSTTLAAICSAILVAQGLWLMYVLQKVRKLDKHW